MQDCTDTQYIPVTRLIIVQGLSSFQLRLKTWICTDSFKNKKNKVEFCSLRPSERLQNIFSDSFHCRNHLTPRGQWRLSIFRTKRMSFFRNLWWNVTPADTVHYFLGFCSETCAEEKQEGKQSTDRKHTFVFLFSNHHCSRKSWKF